MRDEQLRLKIIAMSAVPSTSDLQQLLAPLPLAALGWLCVGFHIADAPGRADTILALLVRAGLAAAPYATRQVVSDVLARVLARAPHLITVSVQDTSLLVPSLRREALHPLARFVHDFAPLAAPSRCSCGHRLVRWRKEAACFFTLARGMVPGKVLFLRCFRCSSVCGPSLSCLSSLGRSILQSGCFYLDDVTVQIAFVLIRRVHVSRGPAWGQVGLGAGQQCRRIPLFHMGSTVLIYWVPRDQMHAGSMPHRKFAGKFTCCVSFWDACLVAA